MSQTVKHSNILIFEQERAKLVEQSSNTGGSNRTWECPVSSKLSRLKLLHFFKITQNRFLRVSHCMKRLRYQNRAGYWGFDLLSVGKRFQGHHAAGLPRRGKLGLLQRVFRLIASITFLGSMLFSDPFQAATIYYMAVLHSSAPDCLIFHGTISLRQKDEQTPNTQNVSITARQCRNEERKEYIMRIKNVPSAMR